MKNIFIKLKEDENLEVNSLGELRDVKTKEIIQIGGKKQINGIRYSVLNLVKNNILTRESLSLLKSDYYAVKEKDIYEIGYCIYMVANGFTDNEIVSVLGYDDRRYVNRILYKNKIKKEDIKPSYMFYNKWYNRIDDYMYVVNKNNIDFLKYMNLYNEIITDRQKEIQKIMEDLNNGKNN